jgi:hypothetical protein
VHRLTSLPNGNALDTPKKSRYLETHGPYQHGAGFPAVNGGSSDELFSARIPLTLAPAPTGPQYENVFASEFGCVVMSSFESMSPTLDPQHWGLHAGMAADNCTSGGDNICTGGNPMAQRNYPCDNIIEVYFGRYDLGKVGEQEFKKQLYHCMLGQALEMKADIQARRAQNQLGVIVWQLNEIWPTGGWGSLEYGNTALEGQVLGGRWKPLHYWYKALLFADVMATCGARGVCYVRNDGAGAFDGTVTVTCVSLADGSSAFVVAEPVTLASHVGESRFFTVDTTRCVPEQSVLVVTATGTARTLDGGTRSIATTDFVLLAPPKSLELKPALVTIRSVEAAGSVARITLQASAVGAYITLTTLAQGRFSENAFWLLPDERTCNCAKSLISGSRARCVAVPGDRAVR